jgi:hypothetical protein
MFGAFLIYVGQQKLPDRAAHLTTVALIFFAIAIGLVWKPADSR